MNWTEFWIAMALVLILEGMLPFLSPRAWRRLALMVMTMDDRRLRRWGLVMMLVGTGLLSYIKGQ